MQCISLLTLAVSYGLPRNSSPALHVSYSHSRRAYDSTNTLLSARRSLLGAYRWTYCGQLQPRTILPTLSLASFNTFVGHQSCPSAFDPTGQLTNLSSTLTSATRSPDSLPLNVLRPASRKPTSSPMLSSASSYTEKLTHLYVSFTLRLLSSRSTSTLSSATGLRKEAYGWTYCSQLPANAPAHYAVISFPLHYETAHKSCPSASNGELPAHDR